MKITVRCMKATSKSEPPAAELFNSPPFAAEVRFCIETQPRFAYTPGVRNSPVFSVPDMLAPGTRLLTITAVILPTCPPKKVSKMSISQEHKQAIISEFATKPGDTGSPEVQIAVLTAEIQAVTEHLQTHPKDYAGRRGLLSKVSRRRQLLDYLKRNSLGKYQSIIGRLNIRK